MIRQNSDNPSIKPRWNGTILQIYGAILHKNERKVANVKINAYLCILNQRNTHPKLKNETI